MNSIVYVIDKDVQPRGDPTDPRYKVPNPMVYRRDSLTQLATNDTRRYVRGDLTYNIKIDEYFASIRKYIFDKYGTIKKKEKYGQFEKHVQKIAMVKNKGEVFNIFNAANI